MIIRPLIYLLFFLSTCTSLKDRSLIHAFKFTDKNRQELKRVLGQYQEDSPKFAASHFIIRNMLGKRRWTQTPSKPLNPILMRGLPTLKSTVDIKTVPTMLFAIVSIGCIQIKECILDIYQISNTYPLIF